MSNLEELEKALSIGVAELTSMSVPGLIEITDPRVASKLVSSISPVFLAEEKSALGWSALIQKLNEFAALKGLASAVDFDLAGIQKGETYALITAVVQVFSLIGLFNPNAWESMLTKVDHDSASQIRLSTEEVIKDFASVIESSETKDVKRIFEKLEVEETKRIEAEEKCKLLENVIQSLTSQLDQANSLMQKKNVEVQEAQRVKDMTLRQMEELMSSQQPFEAEAHEKTIKSLNRVKEDLQHKLMVAEASAAEYSSEAEKLRVLISMSEVKRREAESVHEICDRLRKSNEELRAEKEVYESKLELLSVGNKALVKYQEKLKAETQKNFDLKLHVSELENKIGLLEEKARKSSESLQMLKDSKASFGEVTTQLSLQMLEAENESLRQQLKLFKSEASQESQKAFERDEQESLSEIQAVKLRTLSLENNMLTAKNRRLTIASKIGTFSNLDQAKSVDMAPRPSISTPSETQQEEIAKVQKNCSEKLELLYAALMQYAQYSVVGNARLFAPGLEERKRDVLRQFTLNNILNGPASPQ